MLDPHLKVALQAVVGRDVLPPPNQVALWLPRLIPGQAGTTLCSCWDAVGHRTTLPDDPACYGTGVVGGYGPGAPLSIAIYPGAHSETTQTPQGYLETQVLDVAYLPAAAPLLKRGDLLIISPDPLQTPGNPDRRYTVGDPIEPLQVAGWVVVRRYSIYMAELGSVLYRVPASNLTPVPDSQVGTL